MSELAMLALHEQIEEEGGYVIATYYLETGRGADIVKKISAIAVEQTTGTWVPVPEETPEMREKHVAKVVGIYEVPGHEFEVPGNLEARQFIFQLAYPAVNFGPQIPMLLSTVIGNISMSGKLKLLDLKFPKSFLKSFKGPKFGTQGIRELLGIPERPLLNNMIKPCTGYTPEVGARLFSQAIRGGVDIVKDDELIADPPFCPMVERVKLYMAEARRYYEETGNKVLYTVNITDRADKVKENAKRALDAGANALMINYLTAGITALQSLAEDPEINVPILAHLDFAGTMYESPYSGLSSYLILGKLARLAGADIVVYPSPFGKFPFLRERYLQIGHHLLGKWLHFKPTFPMPGGGVMPAVVPAIIRDLGKDCILGAGGAIHGHPMGPVAGGKAMRQAIDAALQGIPIREAAEQHPELKSAIEAWGLMEDEEQALFEIKQ
ncbi:ribulose bisphosphate carboxylase-like protein [Thermacetogenium phaeum DSM 12270]|uniref:Ribulose bisphosphate carboxylase-like protein n=1 Tax=Thermacetogenium phaeum (strain ATCC BAA-254 / DSM 26808 / PB) TaxID=1089553 RepID=K4LFC4_THEPS|nr:2,3-diketo-5-methylthiopentyl-1-phosphate enolase [Thermacetogenium phaeum]AFV10695.1 ribulose bisphosphate carboxylase-like protein [Thermacetogenium phaeum DSM 12270]